MWTCGWRDRIWSGLDQRWDVIVIGGGITGAGILREASRAGLRTLLVEARDFASGTSSRSSKLVHGGLRYLKNGEIKLTLESVRERERLLKEGRGLITQLGFLLPNFAADRPPAWVFGMGLVLYDLLALKWGHRHYDALDMQELCPHIRVDDLLGGYRFFDAQTDDARLVLRVIREAVRGGGVALNYARVEKLLYRNSHQVCGVVLHDEVSGRTAEVKSSVVINATGAWADEIRMNVDPRGRRLLRRLRGSHLVFPFHRLPLRRAVSFLHPLDHRPVFTIPWEGVTLFGTTDVDHDQPLDGDPVINHCEVDYLITALQYAFPSLAITCADVQATFSGVRSVVDTGEADPSNESREHVMWNENGLLTVTGGKLTTFRLMAHEALESIRARLPGKPSLDPKQRVFDTPPDLIAESKNSLLRLRLCGRYGADAAEMIHAAPDDLQPIGETATLWGELRFAARAEGVIHLDDLLLRRVRLGLLLPRGGLTFMDRIRAIVQPELGWSDDCWAKEVEDYARLWESCYHLPNAN